MADQETRTAQTISFNGRAVDFEKGDTILEAARRNGVFIPTLCHLAGATPTGSCRVCVVELTGERAPRTLITACTMPASPGMQVRTNSPRVNLARRQILELLMSSGNHNCAARAERTDDWTDLQSETARYDGGDELCEVYSDCKLQALAYRYQVDSSQFEGQQTSYELEEASPLITRDFSRCILCGRCVQACNVIQHNHAISHAYRGRKAKIAGMGDASLDASECVFCGECIQVCPVGALTETKSRRKLRPWEAVHTRTTCHYCGVGCQLDLHVKDNRVMKVMGVESGEPNHGRLCMKGRFGFDFLNSAERLARPRIRENGALRDAEWSEALDLVAARIDAIRQAHGPSAVAGVFAGKANNEALYLGQKLFRAVIGTNNVVSPLATSGMVDNFAALERAGKILLIGSDIRGDSPVAGAMIARAVAAGCALVVIDERESRLTDDATLHLKPRTGTEPVLINGLIRLLLESAPADLFSELRESGDSFPLDKVAETTGVAAADIERAAAILAEDGTAPLLLHGSRAAGWTALFANLQRVLGSEEGRVNPLADLNNSVGAALFGATGDLLPGFASVTDAAARAPFEKAWGCALPDAPGQTLTEILTGAAGAKLLFAAGEDLTCAAAAVGGGDAAFEAAEFVVAVGGLADGTVARADVVLPTTLWVEEEGTCVSGERRVNRVRKAVDGPGEARPAIWIYTELARRLGADWPERGAREIWDDEIRGLVPQVAGIGWDRLDEGGLQWPVAAADAPGTPVLTGALPPALNRAGETDNPHHAALLEQCEGLLASLPANRGGTRDWAADPETVTREFVAMLESEGMGDRKGAVDDILERYRPQRGGLIPVLQAVQETLGYLPAPVQNYIALGLGLPAASVYGVVTFYSFFTMIPRGRHTIRVCLGTACFVKGSGVILDNLESELKIKVGETTADRQFSLEGVRCVGACGLAPVVVVDEDTHGGLDPAQATKILDQYRSTEDDSK